MEPWEFYLHGLTVGMIFVYTTVKHLFLHPGFCIQDSVLYTQVSTMSDWGTPIQFASLAMNWLAVLVCKVCHVSTKG